MLKDALSLYLVTNREGLTEERFLAVVKEACENGVTMVQLREKEATTNDFYQLAIKVKKITDAYNIPLIINDRVDICLAVEASGVHIGDEELPVDVTRQLIGKNKLLGVSAKTVARGLEALNNGADYLGVGAIFPTQTKVKTTVTSLQILDEIVRKTDLPVVAIGGIKVENLSTFIESKISGVAVVSEIMFSQNVPETVGQLKEEIMQIKGVVKNESK